MAVDIYGVFQRYDRWEDCWVDIPSCYEFVRDRLLFAWLCGIELNELPYSISPLDQPRGLPTDFQLDDGYHFGLQGYNDPACNIYMGDHSHSWLYDFEITSGRRRLTSHWQYGVISLDQYRRWNGRTAPEYHHPRLFNGDGVEVIRSIRDLTDSSTHIRVRWSSNPKALLSYFIDEVRRLHVLHYKVRFVFGFVKATNSYLQGK